MLGSRLYAHTLESYIPGAGQKGYFHLAIDAEDRWYWGKADGEQSDPQTTEFYGPCLSRGTAIDAGERWVTEQSAD